MTATERPPLVAVMAAPSPAGPLPMTMTSYSSRIRDASFVGSTRYAAIIAPETRHGCYDAATVNKRSEVHGDLSIARARAADSGVRVGGRGRDGDRLGHS